MSPSFASEPRQMVNWTLPLTPSLYAVLWLPAVVSEYEWERLALILETMRPAFTTPVEGEDE